MIFGLAQAFGSTVWQTAHASPNRSGCESRRRVRVVENGGTKQTRAGGHLGIVALVAHVVVLARGVVHLVLGLMPLGGSFVLALDALRVLERGLGEKTGSAMGSDRTHDTSSHLLVIALLADLDPFLHQLAVLTV